MLLSLGKVRGGENVVLSGDVDAYLPSSGWPSNLKLKRNVLKRTQLAADQDRSPYCQLFSSWDTAERQGIGGDWGSLGSSAYLFTPLCRENWSTLITPPSRNAQHTKQKV